MLLGVWDGYMTSTHAALSSETKIGGVPIYTKTLPHPAKEKIKELTKCKVCNSEMFLLLQCYCPLPNGNEDFNRMKYIFCCNRYTCVQQPDKSWVSFSVTFNTFDDAVDDDEDVDENNGTVMENKDGDKFQHDQLPLPKEKLPIHSFPPSFVEIVDESKMEKYNKTIKPTEVEEHMIAEYERRDNAIKRAALKKEKGEELDSDDELLLAGRDPHEAIEGVMSQREAESLEKEVDLKGKAIDVAFDKFRRRLAICPRQVLRYAPNGKPLLMNPCAVSEARIPPCQRCGRHQVMELQLISTILYFIRPDDHLSGVTHHTSAAGDVPKQTSPAGSEEIEPKGVPGRGVDFATATTYICSNFNCVSEEENLFYSNITPCDTPNDSTSEASESLILSSLQASVFIYPVEGAYTHCGGTLMCNITVETILVERPPSLEDDNDDGGPQSLRSIIRQVDKKVKEEMQMAEKEKRKDMSALSHVENEELTNL